MKLIAVAEVGAHIFRPLVGLGEQHGAWGVRVHKLAQALEKGVRFRQILAAGAFTLEEIGCGIDAEGIHTQVKPKLDRTQHRALHGRVVVVQIRLVMKEAVPEILATQRIECPVGRLGIEKDDARRAVTVVGVAPNVPITVGGVVRM